MRSAACRTAWRTRLRGGALRATAALALALSLGSSATAAAAVVAGVQLPASVKAFGTELALASCGVRDTLWIEHYVAALYLLPDQPVVAMRDDAQPKAILLHIVRAASLPDEIPEQWREPLRRELKQDPVARIRTAYSALDAGDRVWVRYAPSEGLSIAVNDRVVARAQSHALIDAMLRTWAGGDPLSGKLRRLLLQQPC